MFALSFLPLKRGGRSAQRIGWGSSAAPGARSLPGSLLAWLGGNHPSLFKGGNLHDALRPHDNKDGARANFAPQRDRSRTEIMVSPSWRADARPLIPPSASGRSLYSRLLLR